MFAQMGLGYQFLNRHIHHCASIQGMNSWINPAANTIRIPKIGSTIPDRLPYKKDFPIGRPSWRSGSEIAAPSGKFCIPIPMARAIAPAYKTGFPPCCAAKMCIRDRDDCWPAAGGWSLLDYYALPKAGYYAFKRAAKPVIASIDCEGGLVSVWVCNDSVSQAVGEFTLFAQSAESGERTELKKGSFQSEANRAQLVFQAKGLPVDGNELLLCELTWAEGTDRAVLYPQRPCDLRYTCLLYTSLFQGIQPDSGYGLLCGRR